MDTCNIKPNDTAYIREHNIWREAKLSEDGKYVITYFDYNAYKRSRIRELLRRL